MNTTFIPNTGSFIRILFVVFVLALIGLIAGAACVVLPIGTPFVFVGTAGGLLLWLMPDLQHVPETLSRRMFYILLFTSLCIPAYFTIIIPGLPWMSARRLALIAFSVPAVIVLCGSSSRRQQVGKLIRANTLLFGSLLSFLGMIVFSTALSVQISTSLSATINFTTALIIPFFGILALLRSRRDVDGVMRLLVFCIYFDFITGFIEFYLRRPFLIYLLPAAIRSQILASNPLYFTLFQGQGIRNGLYRAASAFNISLSWGEMGAMLAPMAAHFFLHGSNWKERIFGACGFFAAFASIVCSGARGAYVGFLAAMITFALAWALRLQRNNPKSLVGPYSLTMLTMGSTVTILAVLFVGPVRGYVLGNGSTNSSTEARWAEWALAKPRILASPIWGYGPGTSADIIGYHPFGSASPTVDSYLMTALVDYGIVGFLALTCLLVFATAISLRAYLKDLSPRSAHGNAIGCALIAFMVYRITLSQTENMLTVYTLLALVFFSFSMNTLDGSTKVRSSSRELQSQPETIHVLVRTGIARPLRAEMRGKGKTARASVRTNQHSNDPTPDKLFSS